MKDIMKITLEVSKPSRGAFIRFDSEKQAEIKFEVDASQVKEVMRLADFPYGETIRLIIER